MAIDVNGIYGRWPVRTPGIWEPTEYLLKMDRLGIEIALLTGTAALLDNTTLGNDQVASVVAEFPDRFVGAGVVNPQAGPEKAVSEARRCLGAGFRALRLFPGLHNYAAGDQEVVDPVMEYAREADVPVILTLRVTSGTGFAETPAASARTLALRYPEVPVIISGAGAKERLLLTRIAKACPNVLVEISHLQEAEAARSLCEALGSARVLLGTGMGVFYAAPALRKVGASGLSDLDREAILAGNARRLLKLG